MARLIQDVVPRRVLSEIPTEELVATLYIRGVSIEDIFGKYYEYEEHTSARDDELFGNDEEGQHGAQLTVGDAQLAGLANLPDTPKERQPF